MSSKKIIGRYDFADFPLLGLEDIAVKVDTGAYTSSIHCHLIKEIMVGNEIAIKFNLFDPTHENYNEKEFVVKQFETKRIKSSNGQEEIRYIIQTSIRLFNADYPIMLSLSERGDMKYPVLLGRKLLNKNFIVDTSKYRLSAKLKKNK